jgi:hypothetical protein
MKKLIVGAAIITALTGSIFIVNQDNGAVIGEQPIVYSVDSYA